jgi:hypothetical protein
MHFHIVKMYKDKEVSNNVKYICLSINKIKHNTFTYILGLNITTNQLSKIHINKAKIFKIWQQMATAIYQHMYYLISRDNFFSTTFIFHFWFAIYYIFGDQRYFHIGQLKSIYNIYHLHHLSFTSSVICTHVIHMLINCCGHSLPNCKSEMKYESCWKEISPGDQTANANCMNDFNLNLLNMTKSN